MKPSIIYCIIMSKNGLRELVYNMMAKKKILVVDDSIFNRAVLYRILNEEYDICEAENGRKGLEILEEYHEIISVIILDVVMPEMGGYEFLRNIGSQQKYNNIPIIVLTGNDDIPSELKAMELGAWDYVSKPYNAQIMKFRIKNVIEKSKLSVLNKMKYLAEFDDLTKIFNKAKFFDETRKMINENKGENFAFVRFDIDRFQLINSFFGREEGDQLLKYIARELGVLSEEFENMTYGRMESDIFCFCVEYNLKKLRCVLEQGRELMAAYSVNYDIAPSFGIYIIVDKMLSIDTIYDLASLAAKKCKGSYLEYYAFYDKKMSIKLSREQEIVNEMCNALKNQQFEVYFQPKFHLSSNILSGAEALVRWRHPKHGAISPSEFIPIFEQNGFITKLDFYVWEKVCQIMHQWIVERKPIYPISVNISRVTLYHTKLVDVIVDMVTRYEIPIEMFQLEITESAYMENPIIMLEIMEKLHKIGFIIMMDDFGSGYSSLNTLKDIPVDILKIDMNFLATGNSNGRAENIIASIIRMAKWLNMPVIAEGVETKHQSDFLKSIGCEYVQGYYFGKPMPEDEYAHIIDHVHKAQERKVDENYAQMNQDFIWASHSQIEVLFNNVLQAVALYEYSGEKIELLRVNDAFYDLIGYEDTIQCYDAPLNLIDQKHRQTVLESFQRAIDTKDKSECEYIKRRIDGSNVWISLKLKYINQIGQSHLVFSALTDVTVQKQTEIELQKYKSIVVNQPLMTNTMLIVDDIETNRAILREIFEPLYTVLESKNGHQALDQLIDIDYQVDIILLDMVMPELDGLGFLEYRRDHAALMKIPVVVIAAESNEKIQIETLSLGASDYIIKPIIPEVVLRRVSNILELGYRGKSSTLLEESDS